MNHDITLQVIRNQAMNIELERYQFKPILEQVRKKSIISLIKPQTTELIINTDDFTKNLIHNMSQKTHSNYIIVPNIDEVFKILLKKLRIVENMLYQINQPLRVNKLNIFHYVPKKEIPIPIGLYNIRRKEYESNKYDLSECFRTTDLIQLNRIGKHDAEIIYNSLLKFLPKNQFR